MSYLLGIDVGSAEVRCGLFQSTGLLVNMKTSKINIYSPRPSYYQQSSIEIWQAVAKVVKEVTAGVDVDSIKGIGCDATCSLVLMSENGEPVTVSPQGERDQNVVMWMDHRAGEEADVINKTNHELLSYLGGKVSLEMQMPKLMWLKNKLPQSFQQAGHFFDLPDFLTWKLTGSKTRSQCSLVCKWMYEGSPNSDNPGWNSEFLNHIGLKQLCQNDFQPIGSKVVMPGNVVGYLSEESAAELNLKQGIPVAASLIDAHAGTLALVATKLSSSHFLPITNKLGMICGTSSCLMLLSERGRKVEGVWGPYYGAVLDNTYLSEGGQSAAGQLIDHLVFSHPAKPPHLTTPAELCSFLSHTLGRMAESRGCHLQLLTRHFHVYPDFRGNRSPLADPSLRGMICGLELSGDEEALGLVYLSSLQSLAYSARQTVEKLEDEGLGPVKCLIVCGGLSKNLLFVKTLAGAVGRQVVVPKTTESVLLGSAMLGAAAGGLYPSLVDSMLAMASEGDLVEELDRQVLRFHDAKYKVYLKMQEDQMAYKNIMSQQI